MCYNGPNSEKVEFFIRNKDRADLTLYILRIILKLEESRNYEWLKILQRINTHHSHIYNTSKVEISQMFVNINRIIMLGPYNRKLLSNMVE